MMNTQTIALLLETASAAGRAILDVYESDFAIAHKEDKSPLTLADKNAHQLIADRLSGTGIPLLSEEGKVIPYEVRKNWKELWVVDPLDGTKEFIKRNGEFTVNIALVRNGISEFGVICQPVADLMYFGGTGIASCKIVNAAGKSGENMLADSVKMNSMMLPNVFTIVASRSHLSPETASFIEESKIRHGRVELISSGSSLKLCMIADGKAHVYPRFAPTMEWDTAAGHAIVKAAGKNVYSFSSGEEL